MQVIIMKDTKSLNSTALNDIDSKIQHLFGLSSLEEFGRCCESELIDRFINNKIDYKDVDKETKRFFENERKNVKGDFSGGIGCCIRVSQTEAYTVSSEGKDEIQVFEGILSRDYPAAFFRALTRKIDSSGELLSFYEKNSLYFNMLNVGKDSDIQKIMIQNEATREITADEYDTLPNDYMNNLAGSDWWDVRNEAYSAYSASEISTIIQSY